MGRRRALPILGTVLLLILAALPDAGIAGDAVDCDIQNAPCTRRLNAARVTLDIQPRPVKAMKDLQFRISISDYDPGGIPFIDLGMPGMKMGPNRISLKLAGSGLYVGTGVIVRCPSGRRIWYARVTVPELGQVEFTFDVIY